MPVCLNLFVLHCSGAAPVHVQSAAALTLVRAAPELGPSPVPQLVARLAVVVKLKALEVHAQHLREVADGDALHGRHALAQLLTEVRVVALHELALRHTGMAAEAQTRLSIAFA